MAHKDRKTRRKRGTRTCGYGGAQKHRGAGSRGGRGMAGSKKHKWSWVSKNLPGYFGRRGFKRPLATRKIEKTINITAINEMLDKWISDGKVKKEGNGYAVNLSEMGYDKLLGSGKPDKSLVVTVDKCSESAKEKIESIGGKVNIPEREVVDEPGVSQTGD